MGNKPVIKATNKYNLSDFKYLVKKFSLPYNHSDNYLEKLLRKICVCLNLSYTVDESDRFLVDNKVYQEIEKSFINFGYFLTGHQDKFISHKEAILILGSKSRYFDIKKNGNNKRNRENWLKLINTIPVKFYYNHVFYFLKKDVLIIRESMVTCEEIQVCLKDRFNLNLSNSSLKKILMADYSSWQISWFNSSEKKYPIDIIDELKGQFSPEGVYLRKNFTVQDFLELHNKYIYPLTNSRLTVNRRIYENIIIYICVGLNLDFIDERNLDMKYKDDTGKLTFGKEVFLVLEDFFKHQRSYLENVNNYITFKDALKILCGIDNSHIFDKKNDKGNKKRRNNWLNFIKSLPVRFYYKSNFYFLKSDVIEFKKNIVTTSDLISILTKEYSLIVSYSHLYQILKTTFSDYKIEWLSNGHKYPRDIIKDLKKHFPKRITENKNLLPLDQAAKRLGCNKKTLSNFVGNKLVMGYKNRQPLISFEVVNYWEEFKEKTIILSKIMADYFPDGWFQYTTPLLVERIKENSLKCIEGKDTPFNNRSKYIYKEDIKKIKMLLEEILEERNMSKLSNIDKFKIKAKGFTNEKAPITIKEFYSFALVRLELKGTAFNHIFDLYKVISKIEKELIDYTDNEIENLIINFSSNRSLDANRHICIFLNELQKKYTTKYKNKYRYDKSTAYNHGIKNVDPYTEEQFFRFGFLLLNETHEWYESYLEKALEDYNFASLWLYGLLHYICAWRRQDMIRQLPFPTLNIPPTEFFSLIKNRRFTEEMANKLTMEVELKIRYLNLKPLKTKEHSPPNLVLGIPETVRYKLGMLLGICEAHRQMKNKKTLITNNKIKKEKQIEFFGLEFEKIFGGEGLNNLRMNKTFEILIAKKADEMEIGTGYVLASFARSHICRGEQKSNTTLVYLEGYQKLTNGEIVMRELFERGVSSFVPYLILKLIEGEEIVRIKPITTTTENILSLTLHPYDIEIILSQLTELLNKGKLEAKSILEQFGYNNLGDNEGNVATREIIYKFLIRIANGTAPSREENMNCISVAKGLGCIDPNRKTCIGCGQEIYLKTSIFLIGQKLRELNNREEECKTDNDKYKYRQLINQMFAPALREIMLVLHSIFEVNINDILEYRDIAFRISRSSMEG